MTTATTQLPAGYQWVHLDPSMSKEVRAFDTWAFPTSDNVDDIPDESLNFDWDRAKAVATEDGELVAMYATFTFHCPVPGATLGMGGLTWVGVHPGHRRRGLLRAMIDSHFTDCIARGEALSGLTAAEYPIYGRFGYGVASDVYAVEIPRGAALRDVHGASEHTIRIELADKDKHIAAHEAINAAVARNAVGAAGLNRPAWMPRDSEGLRVYPWLDVPVFRSGKEARRIAVVEKDGEPRGYALFARKSGWENGQPTGTVDIHSSAAVDAAAARALWGVLLDLDLMSKVTCETQPDGHLLNLLVNRRAVKPWVIDSLWNRILCVPAALAGRQYQADVDVVLEVTDAQVPANEGRWHLTASAFGEATCVRTDAPADVTLGISELSSAYFGDRSLALYAAQGLVIELRPGAVARTAAAFGWPVTPALSFGF